MGYFCPKINLSKKCIPSAKALYTEDFTFNYFCENFHQITYVMISVITTQLLCTFLTQKLHTFYKSSLSKCKFSDFPLLGLKFTKFLMLFFKQKISFSSKFESLFSAMRNNFALIFQILHHSSVS